MEKKIIKQIRTNRTILELRQQTADRKAFRSARTNRTILELRLPNAYLLPRLRL